MIEEKGDSTRLLVAIGCMVEMVQVNLFSRPVTPFVFLFFFLLWCYIMGYYYLLILFLFSLHLPHLVYHILFFLMVFLLLLPPLLVVEKWVTSVISSLVSLNL